MIKPSKANLTGIILSKNGVLKHVMEGKKESEEEKEDISSYWERTDTEI